jgi:hypothetical protein
MTAKMAAAKVEAFLAALAETGNASLSAKQAGLSRSWVTKARWVDAGLDARVREARAAAAARLGAARGNRPAEGWRMRGGVAAAVDQGEGGAFPPRPAEDPQPQGRRAGGGDEHRLAREAYAPLAGVS